MVREFLDPILDKFSSAANAEATTIEETGSFNADLAKLIHDSADIIHTPVQDVGRQAPGSEAEVIAYVPVENSDEALNQANDAEVIDLGTRRSEQVNDWLEYLRAA